MCQMLSTKEVASSDNPNETTNFRKLLLTRCQQEFEKDSVGLMEVEKMKKEIEQAEMVLFYKNSQVKFLLLQLVFVFQLNSTRRRKRRN